MQGWNTTALLCTQHRDTEAGQEEEEEEEYIFETGSEVVGDPSYSTCTRLISYSLGSDIKLYLRVPTM